MIVLGGSASMSLARDIAAYMRADFAAVLLERFPDGEMHVEVNASLRGKDTFIVQATTPPAEQRLMELLLVIDACRRAGASRITVVTPYFGYARQDRRANGREAIAARLIADLLATAGAQRIVAVDLHSPVLEGFFSMPLEHLTAAPILAAMASSLAPRESVILAPDLGAAKLAEVYARLLSLPVAIVHKERVSGSEVSVRTITGEVAGRALVVVDDMISSGGTVDAAVRAALRAGARAEVLIITSHALLVGPAIQRLEALPVLAFVTSDTVPPGAAVAPASHIATVAPLLADAINRLHSGKSLSDLLVHR